MPAVPIRAYDRRQTMRSHRWRSVQSGLPESAHGCPELVKHALLVEADGMSRNREIAPFHINPYIRDV